MSLANMYNIIIFVLSHTELKSSLKIFSHMKKIRKSMENLRNGKVSRKDFGR